MKNFMTKHLNLKESQKELFFHYFHKDIFIALFVDMRRIITAFIFFILSILLYDKRYLFIIISYFILILEIHERFSRLKNYGIIRTKFQIRSIILERFLKNLLISRNGKVITQSDWKRIKKENPSLYNDIITDECIGDCYYCSRDLALLLKDVSIIYCVIFDEQNNTYIAHAIMKKDNEIYDVNLKRHFSYNDYLILNNVKIYHEYTYNTYCSSHFHSSIRNGFLEFCKQYHTTIYSS